MYNQPEVNRKLISTLEQIGRMKVIVIGDMMLDHYIWGDVHRISPEAPVPVVLAEKDTYTAGGSANVALNLANLGLNTSILGYTGNDEAGLKLTEILKTHGVNNLSSSPSESIPTIVKSRVIIRNQQLCRIDREARLQSYSLAFRPSEKLDIILAQTDAIIISDYAKGFITQELIDYILEYSSKNNRVLISIDPKPTRQLSFKGVGLITPNRHEALLLAELPEPFPGSEYPLNEVCFRIHKKYEPQLLVVTLGSDGMAISKEGKVIKHLPTEAKEVYDVSGAGDTVIATLTAALASGVDIIVAAQLANAAAACVINHLGTSPIQKQELIERLTV